MRLYLRLLDIPYRGLILLKVSIISKNNYLRDTHLWINYLVG